MNHCLDDICISELTFYYIGDSGRIEYTISNHSDKKVSGYFKLVFQNQSLIAVYRDLDVNKSIRTKSQYVDTKISNKDDYVLKKLTKEEISKLKK